MKVVTYVGGVLTVIRESEFYSAVAEKPQFITGSVFYYEPTLKEMDGTTLTEPLVTAAESFIDGFVFSTQENVLLPQEKPCVDIYGNYLGVIVPTEGRIEVSEVCPVPPPYLGYTWDFSANTWYKSLVHDTTNGSILGPATVNSESPTWEYIPESLVDLDICLLCQTYDAVSKTVLVDLEKVRKNKIEGIEKDLVNQLRVANGGNYIVGEFHMWGAQEAEARAWFADNMAATPIIDTLLVSRNLGETKVELVNKIIQNSDSFKVIYANTVGRMKRLVASAEAATTVTELKAVSW